MPRLRFTVRALLIVVAIAGVVCGSLRARERWEVYSWYAAYHSRIEELYREAESYDDIFYKQHPEIEVLEPEEPPYGYFEARERIPPEIGLKALADYHGRMRRYWERHW